MNRATAVQSTVGHLREDILARNEDDWFIGSEDNLLERLGISRPTLRQALRILEHEGLVSIRRGVNGGLYGRVPEPDAVARSAAVYLRSRGTTLVDLMVAVGAMSAEIAKLAAASPDRATLLAWVEQVDDELERAGEQPPGGNRLIEISLEFGRRLAELADNAPLGLFNEVVNQLARAPTDVRIYTEPERVATSMRFHRRLAEAVAAGDAELAVAISRSHTASVMEWLG